MSPLPGGDEERREVIRRSQDENENIDAELARLKAKHAANEKRILRAQAPYPEGDICRDCWLLHGVHSEMKPQPSTERGVDLYRCRECGCEDIRKI